MFNSLIKKGVEDLGPESELRNACEYALTNGGKRFRPSIVFMIAKALGLGADVSDVALAVEYFHTASLVADDMPSMDDDDCRRNKPTTHKVYGEGVALLVTYVLICAGFEGISKNVKTLKSSNLSFIHRADLIGMLCLENATFNAGLKGATSGQFLDLDPPNLTIEMLREIIHKKTGSLFEISFVFGWLFGGGAVDYLEDIKKAAAHFGMAFQIADDFDDTAQDVVNERSVNMVNVAGKEAALKMFHVELEGYERIVRRLPWNSEELLGLSRLLKNTSTPFQGCEQ